MDKVYITKAKDAEKKSSVLRADNKKSKEIQFSKWKLSE